MNERLTERRKTFLALDEIDLPELDARLDRDADELEALARDILARGLIEPLKVVTVGTRYELIDGTSRYLAMKSVGITHCECFIYPEKNDETESIKYRANAFRLEPTPADEAMYFWKLYTERCGKDIEKVARIVGRKVGFVDDRIQLVLGDDDVFLALRNKQIKIGVAQQINRVSDGQYRRYFLAHAIEDGASVSTVARWVSDWEISIARNGALPAPPAGEAPLADEQEYHPLRCKVCGKVDPRYMPQTMSIHQHCWIAYIEPILESAGANPRAE
jgi:ParB/RepB/Spo0J family partition protein